MIDHGVETGVLRVVAGREDEIAGQIHVPARVAGDRPVRHSPLRGAGQKEAVTAGAGLGDDVPAPARPRIVDGPIDKATATKLAGIFGTFRELEDDPRWQEAAARGRAVHDAALALAEEKGILYAEALRELLPDQ